MFICAALIEAVKESAAAATEFLLKGNDSWGCRSEGERAEAAQVRDGEGLHPLLHAVKLARQCRAKGDYLPVVALLLRAWPEAVLAKARRTGDAALHVAAANCAPAAVVHALLAAHPAGPAVAAAETNDFGETPLYLAARERTPEDAVLAVVAALHAANPAVAAVACGDKDCTPLHLAVACEAPALAVVEALVRAYPPAAVAETDEGDTPLHMALTICRSPAAVIRAVLGSGRGGSGGGSGLPDGLRVFAASRRNMHASTLLHVAATFRAPLPAVSALLGAYPAAAASADAGGRLPLHWAAAHRAPLDVVQALLIAHPAGAAAADEEGHTPLHLAAAAGAGSASASSPQGRKAARAATAAGSSSVALSQGVYSAGAVVAALLAASPASARRVSKHGQQPLHCALTAKGSRGAPVEVVLALLAEDEGAASVLDGEGRSPLSLALASAKRAGVGVGVGAGAASSSASSPAPAAPQPQLAVIAAVLAAFPAAAASLPQEQQEVLRRVADGVLAALPPPPLALRESKMSAVSAVRSSAAPAAAAAETTLRRRREAVESALVGLASVLPAASASSTSVSASPPGTASSSTSVSASPPGTASSVSTPSAARSGRGARASRALPEGPPCAAAGEGASSGSGAGDAAEASLLSTPGSGAKRRRPPFASPRTGQQRRPEGGAGGSGAKRPRVAALLLGDGSCAAAAAALSKEALAMDESEAAAVAEAEATVLGLGGFPAGDGEPAYGCMLVSEDDSEAGDDGVAGQEGRGGLGDAKGTAAAADCRSEDSDASDDVGSRPLHAMAAVVGGDGKERRAGALRDTAAIPAAPVAERDGLPSAASPSSSPPRQAASAPQTALPTPPRADGSGNVAGAPATAASTDSGGHCGLAEIPPLVHPWASCRAWAALVHSRAGGSTGGTSGSSGGLQHLRKAAQAVLGRIVCDGDQTAVAQAVGAFLSASRSAAAAVSGGLVEEYVMACGEHALAV